MIARSLTFLGIAVAVLVLATDVEARTHRSKRVSTQAFGIKGTCTRLVKGNQDVSPACIGTLFTMKFSDGHTSFMFAENNVGYTSFLGVSADKVKVDANTVSQPVGTVALSPF